MWMHRSLLILILLVLSRALSFSASALNVSPTASPSTVVAASNGSQNSSSSLPLNNTSTGNIPAYAFNRGFDKPYQRMTILIAALFIAFLFLGFCAHYVTLRSCYIQSAASRNNIDGLQNNELQHAGAGGGGEADRRLEPWLVRSLPVVIYTAKKQDQEEEGGGAGAAACMGSRKVQGMKLQECAVCLSEYQEGEEMKELPVCGHRFHKACIDMWLFSHTTCPICRLSLLKHFKGHMKSSTDRSGPPPPAADHPPPRGPHVAVHLELPLPLDPPAASTSSGFHAVNTYDDVEDDEGEDARNSSAALYQRFPSSA